MQKKLNEDFIEKYSEQFAAKISEDFYASHSHISGQEILNVTPSRQVNFFVIKFLFNNWQQESQRLESPFFNYRAIEVKKALLQFMNVLSRFIQVERKEFEALLQDAIRDTLFLIMAPNAYLEIEFDRKGTEELNEKMAKGILKYIKIAKTDFEQYFQENIGVDKDDLSVDEGIMTDAMLEKEIAKLNEVIPLSLMKLENGDEEDAIEDLLRVEEEDQEEEKEALKMELGGYASPTIARASGPKERVAKIPAEEGQVEEGAPESEENEYIVEETEIGEQEASPTEEPNLEEPPGEPPAGSPGESITNMAPGKEDDKDDDILNDKFEDPMAVPTIAESHEGQTDSMMAAISVNHRYMFINELFDGEADLFTEAIGKVETCKSFDESVEILVQNYAKEFHWNMSSDEVKELLKIIFRRFR